jgi:hypothetical protein
MHSASIYLYLLKLCGVDPEGALQQHQGGVLRPLHQAEDTCHHRGNTGSLKELCHEIFSTQFSPQSTTSRTIING